MASLLSIFYIPIEADLTKSGVRCKSPRSTFIYRPKATPVFVWRCRDSNPGPLACQARTLPPRQPSTLGDLGNSQKVRSGVLRDTVKRIGLKMKGQQGEEELKPPFTASYSTAWNNCEQIFFPLSQNIVLVFDKNDKIDYLSFPIRRNLIGQFAEVEQCFQIRVPKSEQTFLFRTVLYYSNTLPVRIYPGPVMPPSPSSPHVTPPLAGFR